MKAHCTNTSTVIDQYICYHCLINNIHIGLHKRKIFVSTQKLSLCSVLREERNIMPVFITIRKSLSMIHFINETIVFVFLVDEFPRPGVCFGIFKN